MNHINSLKTKTGNAKKDKRQEHESYYDLLHFTREYVCHSRAGYIEVKEPFWAKADKIVSISAKKQNNQSQTISSLTGSQHIPKEE